MADQTDFAKRLDRIAAEKGGTPPSVTPAVPLRMRYPAPSSGGGRSPILPLVALVIISGAGYFAQQEASRLSESHLTPQGALSQKKQNDTAFRRCADDPDLRSRLKAQGHNNIELAALLMCG